MADVQAHTVRLITLFVSCVLYGIHLTTFFPCLHALLFAPTHRLEFKPRSEIKFPILAITISMFVVSSFDAVVSMRDVLDGFINYTGPGGALEFYTYLDGGWKQWIAAVEDTIQVTLGDGLLIYRCYVLSDRKWRRIIVPVVTYTVLVVLSITTSYREGILPTGKRLDDPSVFPFLFASMMMTFSTSVITTYLIIRRLILIDRSAKAEGAILIRPHILTRVATLFLESGLIYTLSILISFAVYLMGSRLDYVAAVSIVHVIPISCNLLLIRVKGINSAQPYVKIPGPLSPESKQTV